MATQAIELVVFDLDGTLLDSVPDLATAADRTVREFGYPGVTIEQVRDYVGNGADVLIARSFSQGLQVDASLSSEMLQQARLRFDEYYAQTDHQESHLYPEVEATLQRLKAQGLKLAIVTNKPCKFVPEILRQHRIADYFDDVIGGEQFPLRKPDPMALNWLLNKYQLSAEQMLMVGDSKNDILAAKNAKCRSFALTYGYNHGEPIADSQPDFVADCIDQLDDALAICRASDSSTQ